MKKTLAIELLGGTPKKAAAAMGYRSIQAVYLWPEVLPQSTADRVRGVLARSSVELSVPQCSAEHLTPN